MHDVRRESDFSNILPRGDIFRFLTSISPRTAKRIYCSTRLRMRLRLSISSVSRQTSYNMPVTEHFIKYSNHSLYRTNAQRSHRARPQETFHVIYYSSRNWWARAAPIVSCDFNVGVIYFAPKLPHVRLRGFWSTSGMRDAKSCRDRRRRRDRVCLVGKS